MQKTEIAIALGSNLKDREGYLRAAVDKLCEEFLESPRLSSVWETEPWGITEQPRFLNMVVCGFSEWKPPALVNYFKSLEREIGRTSTVLNGPREIDIDLIAYAEKIWEQDGVTVPHPRLTERAFVLLPLSEVWPHWTHPSSRKSVRELVAALSENQRACATNHGPLRSDTTSR